MTPVFLDHPKSSACLLVPGKEHINLFLNLQNNPESRGYLARSLPLTRSDEEEWVTKAVTRDNIHLVVAKKPCKTPIGSMGLHHIDWKNRRATTGAALTPPHWGKGYGSDAKMLLLHYAFFELGLTKIESRVLVTNKRSQAYSKKCGYEVAGCLKRHHFRGGRWIDEVVMEVHASAWRSIWRQFEKGTFYERRSNGEKINGGWCLP